jgi:hypothetical protein
VGAAAVATSGSSVQTVSTMRDAYVAGRDIYVTDAPAHPLRSPYDRNRPVFVQYLNPEILSYYGHPVRQGVAQLSTENALHATRLAVLATDAYVVIPASYLFEVPGIADLLRRLRDLVSLGQVSYCAPVRDIAWYGERKVHEYRSDRRTPYATDSALSHAKDLGWTPRRTMSTANDIGLRWADALDRGGELSDVLDSLAGHWPTGGGMPERELRAVPDRLAGQAFVSRFVRKVIPADVRPDELCRIGLFVSKVYLSSYLHDLDAMILCNFRFGDLSCGLSEEKGAVWARVVSARSLDLVLGWLGLTCFVHRLASWSELLRLRSSAEFGTIAVASQDAGWVEQLRRAVIRSRRSMPRDSEVRTLDGAESVVGLIATTLHDV